MHSVTALKKGWVLGIFLSAFPLAAGAAAGAELVPENDPKTSEQLLSNDWTKAKAARDAVEAQRAAEKTLLPKGKKLPSKPTLPTIPPPVSEEPAIEPVNDNCANATAIGEVTNLSFSTIGASTDGPLEECGFSIGADIWYCYTASCSAPVTIGISGVNYPAYWAIYDGCTCPPASAPLACGLYYQNPFTLMAEAGSKYLIRIGSYTISQGSGLLSITCRTPVICPPGGIAENEPCGSDINGGCNSSPPIYSSINCGDTVCGTAWADNGFQDTDWYRLVLTQDTIVTWSAVAEFPIRIFLLNITNGCYGSLIRSGYAVAYDTARLSATLSPGSYAFFVAPDDFYGLVCSAGPFDYTAWLTCVAPPPPPPNDECANAIPIGEATDLPFFTQSATFDGPGGCVSAANIWYRYTASCDAAVTVSTCGSNFSARIAVYKGSSCDPVGPRLACGQYSYSCPSSYYGNQVSFAAAADFTYLIEIGGGSPSDTGHGLLNLNCGPPPPANDDCANAIPIGDTPYGRSFSTLGATTDGPDEPASCSFLDYSHIESDIWYCYTAPCTGEVTVSVCGSGYDTKLAVYEGCECPVSTQPLACNDDTCGYQGLQSQVAFQATAGSSYLIRIGGYGGVQGTGSLTVRCVPPCTFTCPPGVRAENETCGTHINDGCSYYPYNSFGSINCGDTICGTSFAGGGSGQDADWYRVTFPTDTFVTWSVVAEFPVYVSVVNLTGGCYGSTLASAYASRCDTAQVTARLTAGTYAFVIQPNSYSDFPCSSGPHEYVAWLECAPAPPPPPNNACANATPVGEVTNLSFSMEWATFDGPGGCFYLPDVWFSYTASCTAPVTVSAYGSSFSSRLAVYQGSSCSPLGPRLLCGYSSSGTFYATAGETYLIEVGRESYYSGTAGLLTITCGASCTLTCPPGARSENEPCDSNFNNGCSYGYPYYTLKLDSITCGDTICGTVSSNDVDWFQKVLRGESTRVTWSAVAEFPMQLAILQVSGANPCNYLTIGQVYAYGRCDTVQITATLTPGTYRFGVAPYYSGPSPTCLTGPHEYVAWLEGNCCPNAKGDLDGGGSWTASDVVLLINCAFLGYGPCDACYADVNCDELLSAADIITLLMATFYNQSLPCL